MKSVNKLIKFAQFLIFSGLNLNFAFAAGLKSPDDPNLRRSSSAYHVTAEQAKAVLNSAPLYKPPQPVTPPAPAVPANTSGSVNSTVQNPILIGTGNADDDDVGSEDNVDSLEGNSVCLRPDCLGEQNFEVMTGPQKENLEFVNAGIIQKAFDRYSNSESIQRLIHQARENLRLYPRRYIRRLPDQKKAITYCYRAVKDALRESGMVTKVFQGSKHAYQGVEDLKAVGFENLLDDENLKNILMNNPKLAPKGAILVYETVPGANISPSGHIEIKSAESGKHGYFSIRETFVPTFGYRIPQQRRLIGVLFKKSVAEL